MTKRFYLVFLLGVLSACQHNESTVDANKKSNAVKVTTKTVMLMKDDYDLRYSGTIEPVQSVALTFNGTGTVESVFVNEGDMVKKGQALASLDKTTSQNLYEASLASYQQARDAYERLKEVYEKGSLTDMKWVEMETKLKQAESQMLITRSKLDDCTLRAPDNGMIGRRNVEPGQSSMGLNAPFELVKIDRILVKISVPENEISKITRGMNASFSVSALNDQSFGGVVRNVGIVADRISRTYEVKIIADNPDYKIKPGMVCDVSLQLSGQREVIVVPAKAVSRDDEGQPFVWLVNPHTQTATKARVKLGQYHQAGIEVYEGLNENDVVVIEGKEKLSENSSILF